MLSRVRSAAWARPALEMDEHGRAFAPDPDRIRLILMRQGETQMSRPALAET
jgi:hypothetical protein